MVVNAPDRYYDNGSPWAQYDMDEADHYYASIHGLHATPRETLNVHTFRSEFHSLGHSLYRNPVLRGYGTSNMCYSPKLGDAVPKLGSDVITPAPPPSAQRYCHPVSA